MRNSISRFGIFIYNYSYKYLYLDLVVYTNVVEHADRFLRIIFLDITFKNMPEKGTPSFDS